MCLLRFPTRKVNAMDMDTSNSFCSKTNVAYVGAYVETSKKILEIINKEKMNISITNIISSFNDAGIEAKKLEDKVDVIITRGSTIYHIKDSVSVPVISIPISPFDLMVSIQKLPKEIEKIAFFNYERNLYGIEEIERLLSKSIVQYTFNTYNDIVDHIADVRSRGIKAVIGGGRAAKLAIESGLLSVETDAGEEAIFQSLQEAVKIADIKKKEKESSVRLQSAFDSLVEGIVVTDEGQNILVCNPVTERIFSINKNHAIGKNAVDLGLGEKLIKSFQTANPETDYLQKVGDNIINICHHPIHIKKNFIGIVSTYQDVTRIQNLETQIRQKLNEKGFLSKYTFDDIITATPEIENEKKRAILYAKTQSAILIEGESGTGKELFAQSIHNASKCSSGPFVAVNCTAIPENLLESELFGYEAGAFTGARKEGKPGLFELAHNGTIFLDEIGDMPKHIQARLLRVLQEREIMRIAGDRIISINCRVISATNKDLKQKVESGDFREDLYYRLNVFNINIPPLRNRKNDIPILFNHFVKEINPALPLMKEDESDVLMKLLLQYNWPGNIRELYNIAERYALLMTLEPFDNHINLINEVIEQPILKSNKIMTMKIDLNDCLNAIVERIEKEVILKLMEIYNNDRTIVMEKLGISRTTLWRKLGDNINE